MTVASLVHQGWCLVHRNIDLIDMPELRNQTRVFVDRAHAGEVLSRLLGDYADTDAIVLAIPAGGVPVGAALAGKLNLDLDVAVVSKITLPWDSEAGYGAVAFDGTVALNEELLPRLKLTSDEIEEGIETTRQKVWRRSRLFRGDRGYPDLSSRTVLLVDDGLASGFTLKVAATALAALGVRNLNVAVPTCHVSSVNILDGLVSRVYCPDVRGGYPFAVASAYQQWRDVTEEEALSVLRNYIK